MFPTSTQLKFWTFSGTTELQRLRTETNHKFVEKYGQEMDSQRQKEYFLTAEEEMKIFRHYQYLLHDFCSKFQPTMPKYVLGSAILYFKRFCLHNSVMDYHPIDIVYTCVYMACKIEEFNVSIMQFVSNLKGDRARMADTILAHELLLMHELHYHLTVHNPFRPLEGLLIDIKTRYPDLRDVEKLRPGAEDFIDRSFHSDVGLIFAPSQIALAAVLNSGSKNGLNLDSYVANKLLGSGGRENLMKTIEHIKRIRCLVKNIEQLNREEVRALEPKLEQCRNQENNPVSDVYQQKLEELLEEEEERKSNKRQKLNQKQKQADLELLGI